jgi:hypothetical protein
MVTPYCSVESPSRPVAQKLLSGVPILPEGGVGGLFPPLVDADWGIMDQLATHSTGHLGFE